MFFCSSDLEEGILCLPWARSLALSGIKDSEGWHSSIRKSKLVTGRGTNGCYKVREVSVTRPLLLTGD